MNFKKRSLILHSLEGQKSHICFEMEMTVKWVTSQPLNLLTKDCVHFAGTLSEEDWKPPLPAYNFLQMMEAAAPEFTLHASSHQEDRQERQQLEGSEEKATVRGELTEEVGVKAEKAQGPGRDLRGTAPRLAGREKQARRHSEL